MADSQVKAVESKYDEWQSFRNWAVSFVVCNFNVDVGTPRLRFIDCPEVEFVYPPDTPYTRSDLTAICFNSFPERHEHEAGEDSFFGFVIPSQSPDIVHHSPLLPPWRSGMLVGSCCFRQEYDSMTKRRYNQKSLVLISSHNFNFLFKDILAMMAASSDFNNVAGLATACQDINRWPCPRVGIQTLRFRGRDFYLQIEPHSAFPLPGLSSSLINAEKLAHTIYAYEPTGQWHTLLPLFPTLIELFQAFEKLILGESVIVLARDPQHCSDVISCLADLMKPVPFGGTLRPYLTMQTEFLANQSDPSSSKSYFLGLTNPFLLQRIIVATDENGYPPPFVLHLRESVTTLPPIKHTQSFRGHYPRNEVDVPGGLLLHPHSRKHLKSDREFLAQIDAMLRDSTTLPIELNFLVRRYFADLTAQLLSPLNRYFATHLSSVVTRNDHTHVEYAAFNLVEFLKDLAKHGSTVRWKGSNPLLRHRARDDFYRTFCESPNFFTWLNAKCTLEQDAQSPDSVGTPS